MLKNVSKTPHNCNKRTRDTHDKRVQCFPPQTSVLTVYPISHEYVLQLIIVDIRFRSVLRSVHLFNSLELRMTLYRV